MIHDTPKLVQGRVGRGREDLIFSRLRSTLSSELFAHIHSMHGATNQSMRSLALYCLFWVMISTFPGP